MSSFQEPFNEQFIILYSYIFQNKMNRNDGYRLRMSQENAGSNHIKLKIGISKDVGEDRRYEVLLQIEKLGKDNSKKVFRLMNKWGAEFESDRFDIINTPPENEGDVEFRWAKFQAAMLSRFEQQYDFYIDSMDTNIGGNSLPPMSPGPMRAEHSNLPSSGPIQMWMCLDKLCNLLVKIG